MEKIESSVLSRNEVSTADTVRSRSPLDKTETARPQSKSQFLPEPS